MSVPDAQEKAIQRILAKVDALGLFPQAAMRIHEVASDPNSSHGDMEKVISLEPALSVQILRIANSPFYGLRRNVGNLRQAIFVLGFRAIQGLALSLAVMHMGGSEDPVRRRAWRHAIGVGVVSRRLASAVSAPTVGEAFVAGLLHDLGRTLLAEVHGTEALGRIGAGHQGSMERLQAETAEFGVDHAMLGAACLEGWQLPEGLCAAVRFHHEPAAIQKLSDRMSLQVAALVWAANEVENGHHQGRTAEEIAERVAAVGLRDLDRVTVEVIAEIQSSLEEELEQLVGLSSPVRGARTDKREEPPRCQRAWG